MNNVKLLPLPQESWSPPGKNTKKTLKHQWHPTEVMPLSSYMAFTQIFILRTGEVLDEYLIGN